MRHGLRSMVLMFVAVACSIAYALELPLEVKERAGFLRVENHVDSGIPLPVGKYKDTLGFALYDSSGKRVPAQFVVRERWLKDDTIRFMTVHFSCSLPAGGTAKYVLKDDAKEPYPFQKRVEVKKTEQGLLVDNGVISFTVNKGEWHLFDEVKVGDRKVLASPGRVVFKAEYGTTPNAYVTRAPEGLEIHAARAVAKRVEVEEKFPGRCVVLVRGTFMEEDTPRLDFVARYYVLAGNPSVRVAFTVINNHQDAFNKFTGIRSLGFHLPLALGKKKFYLGVSEGKDLEGELSGKEKVVLLQPHSLYYVLKGKVKGKGECKKLHTKRVGWISLGGDKVRCTAAVRWFWQTHPKALAAGGDGVLKIYLVPPQKQKAEVPEGAYTEPQVRVDLYTGGARTHYMLFSFTGDVDVEKARGYAMGVMEPLFAVCPTSWYCQKTLAFGKICDVSLDNYVKEVRDLVRRYEVNVDRSFTIVNIRRDGTAKKDCKIETLFPIKEKDPKTGKLMDTVWCSAQRIEEYGWLNFGEHVEHSAHVKPNDWLNTQWDGNYYDYPMACLLRFVRTGMMKYWDEAQSAALQLADINITHHYPGRPELAGMEHVCPNAGHFRTYWGNRAFRPSGNVHTSNGQSLFEMYNMTGDAWFRETGLLFGRYLVHHRGNHLRGLGNRAMGLFCAYRATRDEKFFKAWKQQIMELVAQARKRIGKGGTGRWDQAWQYGLACEAIHDYISVTGDTSAAEALVLAAESLMKHPWGGKLREYYSLAGFTVPVFGYAYEVTGDIKYMRYGIQHLDRAARNYAGRSKSFAQLARISPQFLWYLRRDYTPPAPVYGDRNTPDPLKKAFEKEEKKEKKGVELEEL